MGEVTCHICKKTVPAFMGVPSPHACGVWKITMTNTTNKQD